MKLSNRQKVIIAQKLLLDALELSIVLVNIEENAADKTPEQLAQALIQHVMQALVKKSQKEKFGEDHLD